MRPGFSISRDQHETTNTSLLGALLRLAGPWGGGGTSFETIKTQPPKGSEDSVLYMTSNGFTQDEQYFVFGRRQTVQADQGKEPKGRLDLYRRNMATEEETILPVDVTRTSMANAVIGGNSAFFISYGTDRKNTGGMYEMGIAPISKPKLIWSFPAPVRGNMKYKVYPLSATRDGNTVLIAFQDDVPVPRGDKLNEWHEPFMKSGAHAYLYIGNRTASGWEFKNLLEQEDISKGWIGHAQLNPDTGKDVYYELDGPAKIVEQRGWMIEVETGKISKVYPELNADVHTTHGNYVKDGLIQIQEYQRGGKFSTSDVILVNTKTGQIERHNLGPHMHLQTYEKDGVYFVFGDGYREDMTVRRYVFKNGKEIDSTSVASRGSNTAWEAYHQHARLSPSGKWLVFASSAAWGEGEVVIVKNPLKLD